jgi:hypothetical protein
MHYQHYHGFLYLASGFNFDYNGRNYLMEQTGMVTKKSLLFLVLLVLGFSTTGCASCDKCKPEPVILPCIIPSDLPNTAMGRLGIHDITIGNIHRIIVPTDPIFEVRSARIRDNAYPGLSQLAGYLHHYTPTRMAVTGYTDSLGSYPEDQKLSEKQARNLITYLWTQGIAHECLSPIGIGKDEHYTIASNRGVDGSVTNRRIEITFKAKSFYAPT